MAVKKKTKKKEEPRRELAPATWALIAMGAALLLLVVAGVKSGNWRGAVVSAVQVGAVGLTAWYGLRRPAS
jgi:hypothetical protein